MRQLLLLAALVSLASAGTYDVAFPGWSNSYTQVQLGVGMGNARVGTNWINWMSEYLRPSAARMFITSIQNWKGMMNSRLGRYAKSFSGAAVDSRASWEAAVAELRQASSRPGQPNYKDWLRSDTSIRWSQYLDTLTANASGANSPVLRCSGNPTENIPELRRAGIHVLAVWHVKCKNLPLSTTDRNLPAYWAERWELYRWFYLGGRFLAESDVEDIELYNEPNLDAACLTADKWIDEARIRSVALQQSYEDHSSWSGKRIVPNLIGPPMSAPRYDPGTIATAWGRLAVQDVHTKFPGLQNDALWWNFKSYSYHQYNSPGFGMKSAYEKVAPALNADVSMPIRITEHNCFTGGEATKVSIRDKIDAMDTAKTAACLAGQVISMAGRAQYTYVHKFSQAPIGNGLLWGDTGEDLTQSTACNIGGSTKSGEAYRLLLRRVPGRKRILNYTFTPPILKSSPIYLLPISDKMAYYFYVSNTALTESHIVTLQLGTRAATGAPVIISAVTDSHHGEVHSFQAVPSTKAVKLTAPANSFFMVMVPKVAVLSVQLPATGDATVTSGSAANAGAATTLTVKTSSDGTSSSAAFVKFSVGSIVRSKIVSAVLQVSQTRNTRALGDPEILTIFGTSDLWNETELTWASAPGLLTPPAAGVKSICDNFIDHKSSKIVGHVTVGTTRNPVAVDVTDYLRQGGAPSFMFARMFRFNGRVLSTTVTLPADKMGPAVSFSSREAGATGPMLRIAYAQ